MLYFHHVFEEFNPYHPNDITAESFDRKIGFLSKYFCILSLSEAMTLREQKKLPAKALVISFDDGYLDNYNVALPILEKHQCPATFFIASQGVENGYLWNDVVEQSIAKTTKAFIPDNLFGQQLPLSTLAEKTKAFKVITHQIKFLSNHQRQSKLDELTQALQVREFSASMMNEQHINDLAQRGFDIGAHTHSHTILATQTEQECIAELEQNKAYLEKVTQQPVSFLAYPNGLYQRDFFDNHTEIAKQLGFRAAFSTNDGGSTSQTNPYKIPRFMPYRTQLTLFALSIAKISGEYE